MTSGARSRGGAAGGHLPLGVPEPGGRPGSVRSSRVPTADPARCAATAGGAAVCYARAERALRRPT